MKIEFGTTEPTQLTAIEPVDRKKHGWLPLLVVLFLISYGLMTMLIVEQGRTIDSQRALIRELFRDSVELSAVKMKAQEAAQAARSQSSTAAASQVPSKQAPSTQVPSKPAPSSQAGTQNRAQNQKPKQQVQMPTRPASDVADSARSLITI